MRNHINTIPFNVIRTRSVLGTPAYMVIEQLVSHKGPWLMAITNLMRGAEESGLGPSIIRAKNVNPIAKNRAKCLSDSISAGQKFCPIALQYPRFSHPPNLIPITFGARQTYKRICPAPSVIGVDPTQNAPQRKQHADFGWSSMHYSCFIIPPANTGALFSCVGGTVLYSVYYTSGTDIYANAKFHCRLMISDELVLNKNPFPLFYKMSPGKVTRSTPSRYDHYCKVPNLLFY